ncbi:MAG: ribosome-binding factor RbfA [Rickettsiales bacterium]|jgi:ribosome-binding factor A|nr:ribosome-binding factor RbfA [Rickettsiales bacterium]
MANDRNTQHGPTQRQLRVGEEIRHVLADSFSQGKIYHPDLGILPVTVSEVRISPDLKNATAFVSVLGGETPPKFLDRLNELSHSFRSEVNRKIKLRNSPKITFKLDNSFEESHRIHSLLERLQSENKDG